MIGKLVTEMKGSLNCLSHKYINPIEVGIIIEAIIEVDLGIIMPTGVVPHVTRTLGAGQEVTLIIEETTDIVHKVIRDIEIIKTITEEMVIEGKVTTGIEVGH